MSIYFIRNPVSGKYLNTTRGAFETKHAEEASCRYWSEKAARKTIRSVVDNHKRLNGLPNRLHLFDYPEHYEVVAFRLVEVGVVS